jgi:uncharacterized protein (DUF1778 family)
MPQRDATHASRVPVHRLIGRGRAQRGASVRCALSGHIHAIPFWYHRGMAMTLRLSSDDARLLAALAEAEGVSRHEATLRAIREAASRHAHQAKVADLSARARERYSDVLDRLGR